MPDVILVACPSCGRNNNVQRQMCIYCGTPMPAEAGQELLKLPVLRPMEESENGFNVILLPTQSVHHPASRSELEVVSRLNSEQVEMIAQANVPLPIARAADWQDAELIWKRLVSSGFSAVILSDQDIQVGSPPRRIRKLQVDEGRMELWSSELVPVERLETHEIRLLVLGVIRTKHVHLTEANPRFGGGREVKDINERYLDEPVIDFFADTLNQHFRIRPDSFDYTCLKDRMRLLATENFRELSQWLQDLWPQATVVRDFRKLTGLLEMVWPLTTFTERQPLKRVGLGKIATEASLVINNETQFTRYGRMHFLLKKKELG